MVRQEGLYFRIRLFGMVFLAWQFALSSFFQAIHRPTIPTVVAVVANSVNALLDYLLIFGCPALGIPRLEIAANKFNHHFFHYLVANV